MKKHRLKQKVINELADSPNVSAVCDKLSVSRQTFYRWMKEDLEFADKVNESITMGNDIINDLAEMKLVGKIKEGNLAAIKYRLDNNKYNYIKPRPGDFWESILATRIDHNSRKIIRDKEIKKIKLQVLREYMEKLINDGPETDKESQ